ncbi:MAG: lamin tail domain-containing protein [Verrucomicrobiaceae bacterium]|nr:MAG: lamin tail domain-containing protein [Verrucomicrobiaceae bacterium]
MGEELFLSAADAAGNLTGYRSRVKFGGAADGVSFGRIVNANGADFFPQIVRTFGQDTPATVAQFRTGAGLANSGPKIGPVIINEVMYHPPDLGGLDNVRDEFVELHNLSTNPQELGGWVLKDAVDFTFPANTTILPGDYLLVVGFDPTNTALLDAFRAAYGISSNVPIYGPFSPKLPNSSATVELAYLGAAENGEIPEILVDRVRYSDITPWPGAPDGDGPSLQRISRTIYGNDPSNWMSETATPGNVNAGQQAITDSDGDGMPDAWELANGLNPKSAADAAQDSDGDGQSNASEFLAGTSPANGGDTFRSEVAASSAGGFTVRFTAKAGKTYTVQYRNELQSGSWLKLSDIASQETDRAVEVNDPAASGRRFYRVVTPSVP